MITVWSRLVRRLAGLAAGRPRRSLEGIAVAVQGGQAQERGRGQGSGVSRATVSYVLNGAPNQVTPSTIQEAARPGWCAVRFPRPLAVL